MTDINTVLSNAHWIPHHYDPGQDAVLFAKIPPEEREKLAFLADFKPESAVDAQWVPASALSASGFQRPVHFLFHSAFCRSTLLVKALNRLQGLGGLSEPAICNSLQTLASNPKAQALLQPMLAQISKPVASEKAVVAKPSNFANGLIPALMEHATGTRAVLLYGSLPGFLRSVAKKGLAGRLWARKQLAHNRAIMPLDLGMDERAHYELSDLQCAALAWLLQIRQFAELAKARPDHVRTLDSETFIANKVATLHACAGWFGVEASVQEAEAIADSDLFASHAKQGGDYAALKAEQDAAGTSEVTEEEIAQIGQWIDLIMQQLGLKLPLARPLDIAGV